MARIHTPFPLSGTLGELVTYRRKDLPYTLVRTPTSLTGERFHTDPCFANSRRTATEAGGRSKAAQALRRVLQPLAPVRDHNWQGTLTGALTAVQYRDSDSPYGQRSVLFSRHGHLLEGLCLSRHTPFETLVRTPLLCSLDRPAGTALVDVPELRAGVNFFVRTPEPYFKVVASLGAVPNLFNTPEGYAPMDPDQPFHVAEAYTDWSPVKSGTPALSLELQLPLVPPGEAFALVLAVGVLLGTPNHRGDVQPVGYRGSGRIMRIA